jgi:hypothetical protein
MDDLAPPIPPPWALWLYKRGGEIKGIRVDLVPTGVDTSKTVWHLELSDGSKSTLDVESAFTSVLDIWPSPAVPSWRAIASLKRDLRKMCEDREKWEKAHDRELATYRRLKAKFEPDSVPPQEAPK